MKNKPKTADELIEWAIEKLSAYEHKSPVKSIAVVIVADTDFDYGYKGHLPPLVSAIQYMSSDIIAEGNK